MKHKIQRSVTAVGEGWQNGLVHAQEIKRLPSTQAPPSHAEVSTMKRKIQRSETAVGDEWQNGLEHAQEIKRLPSTQAPPSHAEVSTLKRKIQHSETAVGEEWQNGLGHAQENGGSHRLVHIDGGRIQRAYGLWPWRFFFYEAHNNIIIHILIRYV